MELSIYHTSIYLPHKVQVGKYFRDEFYQEEMDIATMASLFNDSRKKLILRPLSDLTKKITHNGREFTPLADILISIPDADFRFRNFNDVVIKCWNDSSENEAMEFYLPPIIGMNEHDHIKKLHKWHFDTEGLIKAGLAIDINTINK